jgi:beta-aspartyl-dipeptidase (metallo-type)
MALLIRGGSIYAPRPLGDHDLLIAGGRIEAVADPGAIALKGVEFETIDARGKTILPGFIDPHVHILGGGGEGGPGTRAPEIRVEAIVESGITTVIGCLGTDSVTRHMNSLVAKARALEIEGISTFCFCGSYEIPVRTITGSVRGDLVLIDKIIGAGEIALSDHRSSQPTFDEFARLAAECRVGGMLGGKAGILHVHLGDGPRGLDFLRRLIRETEIPAAQVVPTHCNRNRRLLHEAVDWVLAGGFMDVTAGTDPDKETDSDVSVESALRLLLEKGGPLDRVTVSSDGNGSLPVFDAAGWIDRRFAPVAPRDVPLSRRPERPQPRTGGPTLFSQSGRDIQIETEGIDRIGAGRRSRPVRSRSPADRCHLRGAGVDGRRPPSGQEHVWGLWRTWATRISGLK